MKKLITILTAVLISATLLAQSPQKISYQAVIRNTSNQLVTNSLVGIRISIMKNSPNTGILVYQEIQTPTTNANGLVSIEIGGDYTGFDTIHWESGPYFIKTETDPAGSTNYTITGSSQILSVPYALHAKTAESVTGSISETDPVYGASPAAGITSTNISNWNNNMLPAGSSGQTLYHSGTSWLPASNMTNDGFDIWINSLTTHFPIEADQGMISSGPIYINFAGGTPPMYISSTTKVDNLNVDLLDGLHATDFSAASHLHTNLWSLTGNAGTTQGTHFIGTTDNVPLEFRVNNVQSGKISIGSTFYGYQAGMSQSGPTYNSAFGFQALANTVYGTNNTAMGDNTLYNNNGGYYNTAVGQGTLFTNISGHMNTAFGAAAGYLCTGDSNVFLGYQAGYNETGSDKLYIANSSTSTPLIYGDFKTGTVTINNNLNVNNMVGIGTTTPGQKLDVAGGSIRTTDQLISTQATGTAPMAVNSTTSVTNLNADLLDGNHASAFAVSSHNHDHNTLTNLQAAGTGVTYGHINASAQTIAGSKTFALAPVAPTYTSTVATGTAPLSVTSSTVVTNLNADLHDGVHAGNGFGNVPVSNGTVNNSLNADMLDGYHAGNSSGQVPVSNSSVSTSLNADMVDGVHEGKVYLNASGTIASTRGGTYILSWDGADNIQLTNTSGDWCDVWWITIKGAVMASGTNATATGTSNVNIISGVDDANDYGFEIHFGQADGTGGWCSVWLQFANSRLVGHYINNTSN
ncbi:MAG TPA: hypothetical protein PKN48_13340 [Bacteroidales bacterium]|nr:hypothetical protein [Bacteroidales bacterium]